MTVREYSQQVVGLGTPGEEFPDSARQQCLWFVDDPVTGRRRCGNSASNRYGADLASCHVHDKKLRAAILDALEEDPHFRRQLIRQICASEDHETSIWALHHKQIDEWRGRPLDPVAHCVYFVERDGFVKIGRTADLKKRVHDIGKGSCMPEGMSVGPVRLLAVIYCACDSRGCIRERYFHALFRKIRLEGEWFLFDTGMAGFIGGLEGCLDDQLRLVSQR